MSEPAFADLIDVTLADEDTKSILTDNTNSAIQGNVAMQMTHSGGQVCNLCKWRQLQKLQTWQPGCVTYIAALPCIFGYWHHLLVLIWYLHQPELIK